MIITKYYLPEGALCSVHPGAKGAVAAADGLWVDRNIFKVRKGECRDMISASR